MTAKLRSAALAALSGTPTLESELNRLVHLHGEEAVVRALKRVTRKKGGRKRVFVAELQSIGFEDARDWLADRNSLKLRSNSKLAARVAEAQPAGTRISAHRTMMRLLSAERVLRMFVCASILADVSFPLAVSMEARRQLGVTKGGKPEFAEAMTWLAEAEVESYRRKLGEPSPEMSLSEIRSAAAAAPEPLRPLLADYLQTQLPE